MIWKVWVELSIVSICLARWVMCLMLRILGMQESMLGSSVFKTYFADCRNVKSYVLVTCQEPKLVTRCRIICGTLCALNCMRIVLIWVTGSVLLNTVLQYRIKKNKYGIVHLYHVADPGCVSRFPDSNFSSRIKCRKDSGSASKNLGIFNLKTCYLTSREYDPGCSSRITDPGSWFFPSRIQGSKKHRIPDTYYCFIFTVGKLYTVRTYRTVILFISIVLLFFYIWSNISLKIFSENLLKSVESERRPNEHKGSTWLENLGHED